MAPEAAQCPSGGCSLHRAGLWVPMQCPAHTYLQSRLTFYKLPCLPGTISGKESHCLGLGLGSEEPGGPGGQQEGSGERL